MTMPHPSPPTLPFTSFQTPTPHYTTSPFTPTRKRPLSPAPPALVGSTSTLPSMGPGMESRDQWNPFDVTSQVSMDMASSTPTELDHREKRRKRNLANGFAGMSLTPRPDLPRSDSPLPSYAESQDEASSRDVGDEDDPLFASSGIPNDEVRVEVLDDPSTRPGKKHRRLWSRADSSNSESTTDGYGYDSDSNSFHLPTTAGMIGDPRYTGYAQQPDSIEQPDQLPPARGQDDVGVEDMTDVKVVHGGRLGKRKEEGGGGRGRKRRKWDGGSMEVDLEGVQDGMIEEAVNEYEDDDERFEMIDEDAEETELKRKTRWYESEKDRIIITSLSPTSSSGRSRTRSPSPSARKQKLTQPGQQGFTLSPSLLTHLLHAQREQFGQIPITPPLHHPERGLILYRPLGIPPGIDASSYNWSNGVGIVENWENRMGVEGLRDDESRFEDLDDDEDTSFVDGSGHTHHLPSEASMNGEMMDFDSGVGSSSGLTRDMEMAMDIE